MKRPCALVLAALLFGCLQTPAPVAEVPVVEVPARETFVRRVKAEGTLQAVKATPISAPAAERPMKIAWLAPDGSNVTEGDVVVKFDATEMERQLADSESDVDAAKRQIDKVEIERDATRKNRDATAELA